MNEWKGQLEHWCKYTTCTIKFQSYCDDGHQTNVLRYFNILDNFDRVQQLNINRRYEIIETIIDKYEILKLHSLQQSLTLTHP